MILTYQETKSGGEVEDPEDRWSYHTPVETYWNPIALYLEDSALKKDGYIPCRNIQTVSCPDAKKGEIVYLVVVRYTTGCTFGSVQGCWEIINAYKTQEEANAIANVIEEDDKAEKLYEHQYKEHQYNGKPKPEELVLKYKGSDYVPWRGYFEALEEVEIHPMVVF